MQDKIIKLVRAKETKNMVKFDEVPIEGQPPLINNIYVAKWFIGKTENLVVTLKASE